MSIGPHQVPRLARGIKLRFDEIRESWIVLAPERIMVPDETALSVLQLVDGMRDFAAIIAELAKKFDAPAEEITEDVKELLNDLRARGAVIWSE